MEVRTILIVEDDSDINALLGKIMTREGFRVASAFSGTEALLQVERSVPDLILLDMMLPGMDGRAFIAHLRDQLKLDTPVIVISAKIGLSDKVDALALGADDYVTKPFEPDEVVARVQAVLRRSGKQAEMGDVHRYRDLRVETSSRRVFLKGIEVQLTAHEFDIMQVLIQTPDKVFSRELLYELVWKSGYYGEDNAVNVHVSNIRKKLAAIDGDSEYVKTVWGIGFKLA